MTHRCISAFEFAGLIYSGGAVVDDGDPILTSHAGYFARVGEPAAASETATASPGERRAESTPSPAKKAPAKKAARPVAAAKSDQEGE